MGMNRKGFTLIELLIVVVIIGILAAIAIPKFANTKAKAYVASMKSDLRNLVTAEEAFFADSVYYKGLAVTATAPCDTTGIKFCASAGNNITATAGGGGWSATATNINLPGTTCAIFVNTAPVAPATTEGAPACQ
jgi:prepilin-type N-terminal cleavage/methylation domain-containing protein